MNVQHLQAEAREVGIDGVNFVSLLLWQLLSLGCSSPLVGISCVALLVWVICLSHVDVDCF